MRVGILMAVVVVAAWVVVPGCSKSGNEAPEQAPQTESQGDAAKTAEAWLKLVDDGKYGESWDEAAPFFRKAVPKETWKAQLGALRPAFGETKSRSLKTSSPHTSLPGAPDGEYVVMQFDTTFENKAGAVETVTVMKDDGKWRASGYFIK